VEPIFDYPHSGAAISGRVVTGGLVYRGPAAALQGLYFFADFATARIWSFRFDQSDPSQFDGSNVVEFTDWQAQGSFAPSQGTIGSVSTFGTDGSGNAYFANLYEGTVFAIGVDSDGDGRIDPLDRCPAFASPSQADADRNGIGDDCECGDQNGDGTVDVADLVAINAAIFGASQPGPLCDANGDDQCHVADIVAVNADLFAPEALSSCARRPAASPGSPGSARPAAR
jgi:hypothetical protein